MRIATVTLTISRQAGGLFNSVRGLSQGISHAGVTNKVFSGTDSYTPSDIAAWSALEVQTFKTYGPMGVGFTPGISSGLRLYGPDLIHQHSIWTYPSWAVLRASKKGVPRIISPRGALDKWALRHSHFKKRLAMALYERQNILNASALHALCESELNSIREFGYIGPVAVIPNGTDTHISSSKNDIPAWRASLEPGAKVLLYIGRINPKKNLLSLVEGFTQATQSSAINSKWHLCIAGWDQKGHINEVNARIKELNATSFIHYIGPQFSKEKEKTLLNADAFILPSLSEGLPMAVLEAWAAALPTLITEECNLPVGFSSGAAVKIGHSGAEIFSALNYFFSLNPSDLARMGAAGRSLIETQFNWISVGQKMREVYEWVLTKGERPSFIDMQS